MSRLEGLLRSLREEGRREIEALLEAARREAEEIVETAETRAREERRGRLEDARRRTRQEVDAGLAEGRGTDRAELLTLRRDALGAVLDRAREMLEHHEPGADLAARLAREAVAYLPPGTARVRCPPRAEAEARRAASQRGDLELEVEIEANLAGVVASSDEVRVEATLPALLEARRRELEIALAAKIEESP